MTRLNARDSLRAVLWARRLTAHFHVRDDDRDVAVARIEAVAPAE